MSARDVIDIALFGRGYTATEGTADAILSALTAAGYAVEQGWQPIDTAPRDGRDVLVWSPDYYGNPVRASWCATVGAWESDVGMMEDGPSIMADECAGPTAWRPLPAPPAREAK